MTGTVLVVDDNAINLELLAYLMADAGWTVHTAGGAEDVFGILAEVTPDVVLLDLQLPGMDGLTLARRLKGDPATARITIIAVTSSAMKGDDERARAAGCDGYISKPVDTRRFCHQVADVLAKAAR